MGPSHEFDRGTFDARYQAFLETITKLRPSLHRYCSRMTGSVLDGEDIVQETLFQAYRKLDSFDDTRPLPPWLFQIAHHRCIDFLRRRKVRAEAELATAKPDRVMPVEPVGRELGRAVEHLVVALPPKERACVLLKDVFEYSLEEIADLVGSTVGGVKAALKRGRTKLASLPTQAERTRSRGDDVRQLLRLYVDRFNQRDWDGVRELIAADARLHVADRFRGPFSESPYFANYERLTIEWRMALGELDGQPVVIRLQKEGDRWIPAAVIRLDLKEGRIARIADYGHCSWVLPSAAAVVIGQSLVN